MRFFITSLILGLAVVAASATFNPCENPRLSEILSQPVDGIDSNELTSATSIWRHLGERLGLEVIIDNSVARNELVFNSKPGRAKLVLDRLAAESKTFWVPSGPGAIRVALDTPQVRRSLENLVMATFELDYLDLDEADKALRTLIEARRLSTNPKSNQLTIRDTREKICIAAEILESLDRPQPEASIKIVVAEVDVADLEGLDEAKIERRVATALLSERATRILVQPTFLVADGGDARLELNDWQRQANSPVPEGVAPAMNARARMHLQAKAQIHSANELSLDLELDLEGQAGEANARRSLRLQPRLSTDQALLVTGLGLQLRDDDGLGGSINGKARRSIVILVLASIEGEVAPAGISWSLPVGTETRISYHGSN